MKAARSRIAAIGDACCGHSSRLGAAATDRSRQRRRSGARARRGPGASRVATLQRGDEGRARGPAAGHAALGVAQRAGGRQGRSLDGGTQVAGAFQSRVQVARAAPQPGERPCRRAADAACQCAGSKARAAARARCRHVRAEGGRRHLGLADMVERAFPGDHEEARRRRGAAQGAGAASQEDCGREHPADQDAAREGSRKAGRGGEARTGGTAEPAIQRAATQVGGHCQGGGGAQTGRDAPGGGVQARGRGQEDRGGAEGRTGQEDGGGEGGRGRQARRRGEEVGGSQEGRGGQEGGRGEEDDRSQGCGGRQEG